MSQNSKCGCLSAANAMLVKFAEKQMPRKFEVFMYNNYVIHDDTVNSLLTALWVIPGIRLMIFSRIPILKC